MAYRNPELQKAHSRARAQRAYQLAKDSPEFQARNRERVKAWRDKNRERFNAAVRQRRAKRYAEDVNFKLGISLRRRLYMAVRNNHRAGVAVRELGCSIPELKKRLESLFEPGMSWENWRPDGWHIDHIKPIAGFDLSDPEQVKRACHFTNLQPLWAAVNVRKDAFHAAARAQVLT